MKKVRGQIVDILNRKIFSGEVVISKGNILSINPVDHAPKHYILPGFIDSHIHIESSMLVPSEFAKIAVSHGTVATVSDPHEIANVLGVKGVEFMIDNGNKTPFKFNFGAPSCVPATTFESAGATIDSEAINQLLNNSNIKYLAEMMNYPGVILDDSEVLKKIAWAKHYNKPIDGHAPGISGKDLTKYINAGISTDHECFSKNEALEKLNNGMKILIREGSAAKNFEDLICLLPKYYEKIMFCSDDKHPDDLMLNHINKLCARAVAKGMDLFKVLQVACLNPIYHYNLDVGSLNIDDPADFIIVENLLDFKTIQTYISGKLLFDKGQSLIKKVTFNTPNNFNTPLKLVNDFFLASSSKKIRVIEVIDGELITNEIIEDALISDNNLISNIKKDILKISMVNRYREAKPSLAFIKNFGIKKGAIASSVGHDSHNIIAVGVNDAMICKAVNLVIKKKGGICAVTDSKEKILPLPVAGIMSNQNAETVSEHYQELDLFAKQLGCKLTSPYMSLSFMGLLVIPSLKLSDKGLFNSACFKFENLEVDAEASVEC